MKFHVNGTSPVNGEYFVFGSNLSGKHLGGAARAAHVNYGARMGVAVGPTGQSYAIPTVNADLSGVVPLNEIKEYVDQFREFAVLCHADTIGFKHSKNFFVTAIGCGIAGYKHSDIAPLFKGFPDNCDFPEEWKPYL